MKFTTILSVAAICASASAVATPNPEPVAIAEPRRYWNFCRFPGEVCAGKLKRAIEDSHEITEDDALTGDADFDGFMDYYCSIPGKACYNQKRSADALAEASAEAFAIADPSADPRRRYWNFCRFPGEVCAGKLKRAATSLKETLDSDFNVSHEELESATEEEKKQALKIKAIVEKLRAASADLQDNL